MDVTKFVEWHILRKYFLCDKADEMKPTSILNHNRAVFIL